MNYIKKNINKIVVLIVVIFLGVFVYNYISKKDNANIVETLVSSDDKYAMEIIETLNELEKIDIDSNFFTETTNSPHLLTFSDLHDFSEKELVQQEVGKVNPFVEGNFQDENEDANEDVTEKEVIEENPLINSMPNNLSVTEM